MQPHRRIHEPLYQLLRLKYRLNTTDYQEAGRQLARHNLFLALLRSIQGDLDD